MEKVLTTPYVGEISGNFNVPDYQRGYRWGKTEVEELLNDIYGHIQKCESGEARSDYFLQPVVVCRNREGGMDIADGQQRLTTLYLIYKYMHEKGGKTFHKPKFTLAYQTRKATADFLSHISQDIKDENIDSYYIYNAYRTIKCWFERFDEEKQGDIRLKIKTAFNERVRIILYRSEEKDAEKLFARLNIGKIPLSCAELVKAMFLSRGDESDPRALERMKAEQGEIALQWDVVENALHDKNFWYFLTTRNPREFATRIDLILDLIAQKDEKRDKNDRYFTFRHFAGLRGKNNLTDIWRGIYRTFLILKGWYVNNVFYHKIGYLVNSKSGCTLAEIYKNSLGKTKSEFGEYLDGRIAQSVKIGKNYGELDYEHNYDALKKLLLLFNVISVMDCNSLRFPFGEYASLDDNVKWSLEHIHAQNSKELKKSKEQIVWIQSHLELLRKLGLDPALQADLASVTEKNVADKFDGLFERVVKLMREDGEKHKISNLALLDKNNNSAINNSVFAKKREIILEKEREGKFIPYCTKMVFLKCYTSADGSQPYFWGADDRNAYIAEINRVLFKEHKYIEELITEEE